MFCDWPLLEHLIYLLSSRLPEQLQKNYVKEAKYDMAVGHLLLQSFWANEAILSVDDYSG